MTAQFPEKLIYKGQELSMCTEPLGDYFLYSGSRPEFGDYCTALWRGYVGTWEIKQNRLYLVGLNGSLADGSKVDLAYLFPGFPDRVFAHWYTGTLRIPDGKQLEYHHMGYASVYERDRLISIEKGVVQKEEVQHNGKPSDSEAPTGYGVGGFTLFSRGKKQ